MKSKDPGSSGLIDFQKAKLSMSTHDSTVSHCGDYLLPLTPSPPVTGDSDDSRVMLLFQRLAKNNLVKWLRSHCV